MLLLNDIYLETRGNLVWKASILFPYRKNN